RNADGAARSVRAIGGHNRRGEAVSELMSWLSADEGKSKQMVAVPIFPSILGVESRETTSHSVNWCQVHTPIPLIKQVPVRNQQSHLFCALNAANHFAL
ncbi:MAG TPA: hypothetical protein VN494_00935, partial [Patescibacteria group bacterium]|nr:hypothetical protein [Patescibacteria group bacterium]